MAKKQEPQLDASDRNNGALLAIQSLQALGVSEEQATRMVDGILEYKAHGDGGVGIGEEEYEEEGGDGRVEEEEAPQMKPAKDGKVDLVDWLMGKKIIGKDFTSEQLVQAIVSSEVPAPMLMDLVMAKTLDDITDPDFKGSPYPVAIGNLMIFMMAIGRKARTEGIKLYAVGGEQAMEEQEGMTY